MRNPHTTYQQHMSVRMKQLIRAGLTPQAAMKRAAAEWRQGTDKHRGRNPGAGWHRKILQESRKEESKRPGRRDEMVKGYQMAHAQSALVAERMLMPNPGNPGARYHRGQEQIALNRLEYWKQPGKDRFWKGYHVGSADAHSISARDAKSLGIPNPIYGTCPMHGTRIKVNPGVRRVRCSTGRHYLTIPKA